MKQIKKHITASTISKIKKDFRELKSYYPFSQMVFVSSNEIHFEIYAINNKEVKLLHLKRTKIENEKYSKRIYVVVSEDYLLVGPHIYSMERWNNLHLIPYECKHFYDYEKYEYIEGKIVTTKPYYLQGRGYLTCTSVSKANKTMKNPLLENVKSAEMMLRAYELFIRGINDKIVLRQYSHGDQGIKEYEKERMSKN